MAKSNVMALGASLAKVTESAHASPQRQEFIAETEERRRSREIILREVLFDLSDAERERLVDLAVEQHMVVVNRSGALKRNYYEIGRALNILKRDLPGTPMTRLLTNYDRNEREGTSHQSILPFSNATASKFMAIAAAIDQRCFHAAFEAAGRQFAIEMLPDYSATYYLTMLNETAMESAVRDDVIRPDLTVREAQAARTRYEVDKRRPDNENDTIDIVRLCRRIQRTQATLKKLEDELSEALARRRPGDFSTSKNDVGQPETVQDTSRPQNQAAKTIDGEILARGIPGDPTPESVES